MKEQLIKVLHELGFSDYEAKAYLSLLEKSPSTGYALARNSGVPRSKIYEVLDGMVNRGDVFISQGEPIQYQPKPPSELIRARKNTISKQLETAEREFENFFRDHSPNDLIWEIRGYQQIIERINSVIARASQTILLQIWDEDVPAIFDSLKLASQNGVSATIMMYGSMSIPFATVYRHEPGGEEITEDYGGRWIILSIDGIEIVTGIVSLQENSRAAWSRHPGIVMPITEQIKHDLYISEMLNDHREILEASYGPSLRNLRAKFGPPTSTYRRFIQLDK